MLKSKLSELENRINYHFKDSRLLQQALTHSSYVKEHLLSKTESNERLEFLGDALIDAICGEELYRRCPESGEGRLTKLRAAVVCEKALAQQAQKIEIGEYLLMGHGEEKQGGRRRASIMADAVEALIGAVYLDGGYEAAGDVFLMLSGDMINDAIKGRLMKDYKSNLQEQVQAAGGGRLIYRVSREEGPDHSKTFYMDLFLGDTLIGTGSGRSKKQAEQQAAKEALERGLHNVL